MEAKYWGHHLKQRHRHAMLGPLGRGRAVDPCGEFGQILEWIIFVGPSESNCTVDTDYLLGTVLQATLKDPCS